MQPKKIIVAMAVLCLFSSLAMKAQFNTIKKENSGFIYLGYTEAMKQTGYNPFDYMPTIEATDSITEDKVEAEIIQTEKLQKTESYRLARKRERRRPQVENKETGKVRTKSTSRTEGLTVMSLYEEIVKNNIKFPKIVLAQAILETGWFTSSVCRNKGNLFGLVNPRTKTYYEFDDWRDSVKAYYTKVQYRYKSGNYLLWLKKIGYAEDKGYIEAVMRVMKML